MRCLQCQHENASDAKFCNQCAAPFASVCSACGRENASDAKFCNQCGTPLMATMSVVPPSVWSRQQETDSERRFQVGLRAVIALLHRERRVTYRTLKYVLSSLDDALLKEIHRELAFKKLAIDEDGEGLVWIGETQLAAEPVVSTPSPLATEATSPVAPALPPLVTEPTAQTNGPAVSSENTLTVGRSDESVVMREPVRSGPEAERRQLTVMFCDLVGSTDLSGTLDPEDLREVVRAYQEAAAEVVKRYEGHIAQYLGDGLLIYFGFPVAHEDDTQRAVHTGLGIVDVMVTLNTQLETNYGVQLAVRIGIHIGSVVIGEMGSGDRHEQLALGETPNIAARLEGLAAPNTIVMSEVVHRMVQGYFVCRDLGDHQLKGISEPLRLYQVLQPSGAQSRLGAAVRLGLSPFSGREVEYRILEALWMRVCQGQGQFCFVLGHAGIGKSRLIYEFTQTLDSISICTVQASNSGQALLYHPFRKLSEQLLELPDDLPPSELQNTITDTLKRYNLSTIHTAALTVLLGGKIDEELIAHRESPDDQLPIYEAVRDLLIQKSASRPAVIVLEDLHGFDNASQALLAFLVDSLQTIPVLLIGTTRPPLTPMWRDSTHISRIVIHELDQDATRQLINHVLESSHAADSFVAFIHERTEGNPLFIEELVQSLKQGNQLQDTSEGTILTQEPENIPPTIQSLLTARLDHLPDTNKQLAHLASVVGMESPEELLSCLVEAPDGLDADLAELHRQGVMIMQRRGQQVYYRFAHTLLQEVAYNALLRSERQIHHLRVAQALESLYPDHQADYAEILAYHYTRSAQSESAIPYLLKSAERAQAVSAVQEALHYLQTAGTILETLDRSPAYMQYRFEVLFHQERLYDILGNREQQQALIDQLLTLLQSSKDQARLADVYVRQGDLYTELARFEAAEQALEEALHLRRTLSDPVGESQVLRSLGFLRWRQGQYGDALTHNEAALALDRQRDDHMTVATDLTNLAAVLRSLGDHERALTCLQEALDIYEAVQHPTKRAFTLYSMANIHREERTHERALTQYQQAYDIFVIHQDRLMASRALAGIASIRWEQGDTQDSLRLYHEVLQMAREGGHGQGVAQTLRTLGELLLAVDQPEQALPYLDESTAVFAELEDHASAASVWVKIAGIYEQHREAYPEALAAWDSARALRMQASDSRGSLEALQQMARLARHHLGAPTQAMQYLRDAVTLAEEIEEHALQGELRNTLGILAWRQAQYEEALEHYELAFQLYRDLEDAANAGVILNSIGVTLRSMKRYDEALARLQEAVATNRQAQQQFYEGHGLAAMGDVYLDLEDYEQAREHYQASLELRREIGDRRGEGWMLYSIAQAYEAQDLKAEACGCIEQMIGVAEACGDQELRQAGMRMRRKLQGEHGRESQGSGQE